MWSRFARRGLPALIPALLGLLLSACFAPQTKGPAKPPPRPVFYPLPPDPPHVEYLTAINMARDVVPARTGLARLVFGERDPVERRDTIRVPYGIAVWKGKIYICDLNAADVKVINLAHRTFGALEQPLGLFSGPTNLCIDREGFKFIVESLPKKIHVYNPDDKYLGTFYIKDGRPGDVAAIGKELFVTDVTGGRILVLERSTGKLLRTFGSKGKEPGQFGMPNAIALDGSDDLYVCDHLNFRIQKIDRQGKSLLTMGSAGDAYGSFARPRGVAVGPDGIVYAVDSRYEIVQMFDQKGEVLMGFGHYHGAPGFLELPAGIAVDKSCLPYFKKYVDPRFEPEYLVFVASQVGAAKIGVYAYGQLKPGAEVPTVIPELEAPGQPPEPEKKPAPGGDTEPAPGEGAKPPTGI